MGKYQLHKDLSIMSNIRISKYTRSRIMVMNALFRISLWFAKTHRELFYEKIKVKGFKNQTFKMIAYCKKEPKTPSGALLFFHGGGFFLSGTGTHLRIIQNIALKTGRKVFFVKYHLSIKYPFPHGLMDCYEALKWVYDHREQLNIDPNKIALMGDSAGGNLAAATALYARDYQGPKIEKQLLLYPVLDLRQNTPSMIEYTDTPIWNSQLNRHMWDVYVRDKDNPMIHYASPSLASLEGLPETYIETAEFDCLRDEAIDYEKRLIAANVKVKSYHTKGSVHGYDALHKSGFTLDMMKKRIDFLNQ